MEVCDVQISNNKCEISTKSALDLFGDKCNADNCCINLVKRCILNALVMQSIGLAKV